MKVPNIITKIFSNKYFLYLMVFLAVTNIIGYMMLGNIHAVIYFILIGLFTAIFSRNMSIILLVALLLTNLIIVNMISPSTSSTTNTSNSTTEGFEEMKKEEEKKGIEIAPGSLESTTQPDGFSGNNNLSGSKVDYASTVENAYDNLNKILGGDGMKRLTDDTQELIKKQKQLAESMQSMTPLIQNITPLLNQTKDMLGNVDMKNIDQIASLFTNLTGKNT
jgi:hypothetical protein